MTSQGIAVRQTLRQKQKGRCCYSLDKMVISDKAHAHLPANAETLEHLERRTAGGRKRRDNLALACLRCNRERGAMDWLTYTTWRRGEFFEILSGKF